MLNLKLGHLIPAKTPVTRAAAETQTAMRPLMRIVVLNAKGGCGKTTLSTNLSGYYASRGYRTALLDADTQGSSLQWLKNRGEKAAGIIGIDGTERNSRVTRSFQLRVPPGTERLVVDSPAALDTLQLQHLTRDADAILIPVLPSDIDIHAASRSIAEILLTGRIHRRSERVAVIANRVKKNTLIYERLRLFLQGLGIPFIASLRDTQNYVHASESGLSIHELDTRRAKQDMKDWDTLIAWLEERKLPQPKASAPQETNSAADQPAG